MTDKTQERVLVVPTAIFHACGVFQGFSPRVDHYFPRLLDPAHLSYRPRADVETDPSFKQIVPYVVLRHGEQVFHYTRGKGGTEARLRALRSVGVGGHISADDRSLFDTPYREALFREVAEEVHIDTTYQERCIGMLNDDSTPVGQVHIGIVHVFELAEPKVQRREQVLTRAGFAPLAELRAQRDEFETWSQFLLDVLT
ncbi:phosphoesterase [Planctomycetaceae bacterium SCGC AG-212-F19]|nr:phosphoesterase [Planctomycetaceae bacterium SCGC AG-212-F19]